MTIVEDRLNLFLIFESFLTDGHIFEFFLNIEEDYLNAYPFAIQ